MSLLRQARGVVRRATRAGLGADRELALHRTYHHLLRRAGRFDPPEDAPTLALLRLLASRARTVLDVGANVGRYTHLFAEAASPSSVIHAFEPHPRALALLSSNVGHDPRVRIHPDALGAADAEMTLAVPLDGLGNPVTALAHLGDPGPGEGVHPVRVRALDALVAAGDIALAAPVLAKIDVEGHEGAVLVGGHTLLAAGAWIYFESQADHLARPGTSSPWPALHDAEYEVIARDGDGWRRHTAPTPGRPNYLAVPAGTLPAGDLRHAAVVAALAGWDTAR